MSKNFLFDDSGFDSNSTPPQNLNPQVEHTNLENLATLEGINIAPSHH